MHKLEDAVCQDRVGLSSHIDLMVAENIAQTRVRVSASVYRH